MRKTFWVFLFVFTGLFFGAIAAIQSRTFALAVQKSVEKLIPSELGIQAQFEGIRIQVFPPRIAVIRPVIEVHKSHTLGVPFFGKLKAERVELLPDLISLFGQELRVTAVSLIESESEWTPQAPPKKSEKAEAPVVWKDFLKVPVDKIEMRDSKVSVLESPKRKVELAVESLKLTQGTSGAPIPLARTLIARALPAVVEFGVEARIQSVQVAEQSVAEALVLESKVSSRGISILKLQGQADGVRLDLSGNLEGDVLPWMQSKQPWLLKLPVQIKGSLAVDALHLRSGLKKGLDPWSASLGKQVSEILQSIPAGEVAGDFRVTSHLERWKTDTEIDFQVRGRDLRAYGWTIESFRTGIKLSGNLLDPTLKVLDLEAKAPIQQRLGGVRSGSEGAVRVSHWETTWKGLQGGFEIPLQLVDAHSNWLSGAEVSTFYPLDTRLSGQLLMAFTPEKERSPWRLRFTSSTGVSAARAILDNQSLENKGVPLSRILDLKNVRFVGVIIADSNSVRVEEGTTLTIGKSKLNVGGEYDFKKGFDIRGNSSQFSMKDLGTLAEIPIQGEGSLGIHVHGPSDRVLMDVTPDLQAMKYLSLNFGHIRGELTVDVETEEVFLKKGELRYPLSTFSLEGVIGLHGRGNISLDLGVRRGDIRDILGMFTDLTQDLSWYPRNLSGAVEGSARISGGLSMDDLVVHMELEGRDWTDFGERFKEVKVVGGYYQGKYELQSVHARKGAGLLQAQVGFVDRTQELEWKISTQDLRVSDVDFLARLDVPMRGSVRVASEGKGVLGKVSSQSEIEVTDTIIRGLAFPPSRLTLSSEDGRVDMKGIGFGGQAQLNYVSSLSTRQPAVLNLNLNRFDFSPLMLLVNPKLMQDRSLLGMVTADVRLKYPGEDLRFASGSVKLDQYVLAKTGVRLDLSHPVTVNLEEGAFRFEDAEFKGRESLLKVEGESDGKTVDIDVSGSLELAVLEFLSPVIEQTKGLLEFQGGVRGKTESPDVYGQGDLKSASTRMTALDAPLENLKGRFQMDRGLLRLQDLTADLSGGRVRGAGTVDFFLNRVPTLQLQGSIDGSKLKVPPLHYVKVSGTMRLSGDRFPYRAEGNIFTDSALYREKFSSGGKVAGGSVATRFLPPPTSRYSVSLPFMEYDVSVRADKGMFVQNDLVDSEWKGVLRITGDPEHPSLMGSADLIAGKMLFKDRAFQMQSGHVVFDTPYEINPEFNVVGQAEVSDYRVQISVSGRPDTLRIGLSSNPVLPESELITLLALGGTSSVGSGGRLTDRTVVQTAEAASLVLQSADFNRSLKDRTGFQLGFDEAVNQELGSSIFKPRSDSDTNAAAPKIVVKRQIGKKIDVSVGSTVGVGSNSQKEVNAEFKVSPGFSVIGVWDSLEGADAQGRESFGVDLKVQKRFK